jgi:hypothetical protein
LAKSILEYVNQKLVPKDKNIKGLDRIEGKFFLQPLVTTVFLYEGHTFLTPILAQKAGQVFIKCSKICTKTPNFFASFSIRKYFVLGFGFVREMPVFENRLLIVNERWS